MILTQEREFLKAQKCFDGLIATVQSAFADGRRIDELEGSVFQELLQLGLALVAAFVTKHGDGNVGPTTTDRDGNTCKRLPEKHARPYKSVFGELTIERYVYGSREGQKIDAVPLDQRLGLPASDFSYLLEDWCQRLCIKEAFGETKQSLEALLGLKMSVRTLEAMNQRVAEFSDGFRDQQAQPPAEEEEAILVVTADGKGVPMRRPLEERVQGHHRRKKGEKANKKQMSYVGAVYTIAPFKRTAKDVIDEVFRRQKAKDRPRPQHKRVRVEMTQMLEGEQVQNGKETLFALLSDDVVRRNRGHGRPLVCLLDGERALWDKRREFFPHSIGVLDLYHVMEKLWLAAHAWHAEGSDAAESFVTARLQMLLEGKVKQVITGLQRRLQTQALSQEKKRTVQNVIRYFKNNREHMRYDEYMAAGFPIGSGVVEGACRHVVKDRMEQSGMRWTVQGAQALLDTRSAYLNGDWDEFMSYRIETEQAQLYGQMAV
jgi:hypothetical protein